MGGSLILREAYDELEKHQTSDKRHHETSATFSNQFDSYTYVNASRMSGLKSSATMQSFAAEPLEVFDDVTRNLKFGKKNILFIHKIVVIRSILCCRGSTGRDKNNAIVT